MCLKVAKEGAEITGSGSEFQWDIARKPDNNTNAVVYWCILHGNFIVGC